LSPFFVTLLFFVFLSPNLFILYFFSSIISGFKNTAAFLSIPSGIIWLFQKFIPTSESLQYLPIIFKTAIETILLAVSSTIVSSIFALFLALIGSETTGINLFTKVLVKIIASFFRNIPLVAWSLVLLFSFCPDNNQVQVNDLIFPVLNILHLWQPLHNLLHFQRRAHIYSYVYENLFSFIYPSIFLIL